MAIDTSPNVAFCGKLEISEMEGIAHETPQKAGGWRDRSAWVGLNKDLPCSLLGGLAQFTEPWLGSLCGRGRCPASQIRSAAPF